MNLKTLTTLYNKIYESSKILTEWFKSTFVLLPKVRNLRKRSDFLFISLMSLVFKVFLKIIYSRTYRRCKIVIRIEQFWFCKGYSKKKLLCSQIVLGQNCKDQHKYLFICSIDYKNRVCDRIFIECLKRKRLD